MNLMRLADFRQRHEWLGLTVLSVILALLFTPIMIRAVNQSADYSDHILDAESWLATGATIKPRPHFLYHSLLIGVHVVVPGSTISSSAVIVGVVFYVLLGGIIYLLLRPQFVDWTQKFGVGVALALTLGLMTITPITLFTIPARNLYFGYIAVHTYHNPTMIVLKPFALLLFLCALKVFTPVEHSRRWLVLAFFLGILATMSKPNYAICLIPALGILAGFKFLRDEYINWWLLIIGIFVSAGLVLTWQYLFFRSSGMGGFGIAPLKVMSYYSPENLLPKLLLSSLFPMCVYTFYFHAARDDLSLNLAWLAFLVGLGFTYFAEEPREWQSGNFLWSGQITLFILFVVSLMFFLRHARRTQARFYATAIVLGLHLVSGAVWYYVQLIDPIYTWW